MISAKPKRTSAYSQDIALRVIWMKLGMNLTFRSITERLQIGLGSACRLYQRYVRTGSFAASKRSDRPECRKLDGHHELLILLMENPGLYLIEICSRIQGPQYWEQRYADFFRSMDTPGKKLDR